jgi:DNA-binding PadR family transcriptional regulator
VPRGLGITSIRILQAIRGGDAYGLEIVARTGLPSGTVYPTLGRLKKSRLVKATWEDQRIGDREGRPRRRYYVLTAEGSRVLADEALRVTGVAAELAQAARGPR